MSAGLGSPCGACKFLRRKCAQGCVFALYFCHDQGAAHFAAIHKVFGASKASKLLAHLPAPHRSEAALTIYYEAQARLQDPVYGCVSRIFSLQRQVISLQAQLVSLKAQTAQADGSTHQAMLQNGYRTMLQSFLQNSSMNSETDYYSSFNSSTNDTYMPIDDDGRWQASTDTEELQSLAYAYLHRRT